MPAEPARPLSPESGQARLSALTSEGQATIPADLRRSVGLRPGDLVEFELDGDRIVLRKVPPLDHAWNTGQARVMSEWDSEEDAVFDE
jgi:AbrB family looped-hinge helix DNA binding protein